MTDTASLPQLAPARARTPLHHWHATHGARLGEQAGWSIVLGYATAEREAEAARSALAIADLSATTKTSLRGTGVRALCHHLNQQGDTLSPRQVVSLPGSGLACRLSEDHLLLLGSLPTAVPVLQQGTDVPQAETVVQTDVTSTYACFWVMGPHWPVLLRRLTPLDVGPSGLPMSSCVETSLAGVEGLLVRSAELSLPGLRLYVPWDLGEHVWERMWEAGRDQAITPVGMEALSLLGDGSGS
jgi:sarcosine oxidase subunit alpha